MEEGLCKSIACAAHGCDILVDDVTVMVRANLKMFELDLIIPIPKESADRTARSHQIPAADHQQLRRMQSIASLVSVSRLQLRREGSISRCSTCRVQMWACVLF